MSWLSPRENCDHRSVPADADHTDDANVHAQRVNEPVGGGFDDVTVSQPMIVQKRSAVIVTCRPCDRVGRCDWLVADGDVRNVRRI